MSNETQQPSADNDAPCPTCGREECANSWHLLLRVTPPAEKGGLS